MKLRNLMVALLVIVGCPPAVANFVQQPPAHESFCVWHPDQCEKIGTIKPAKLSVEKLIELDDINRVVNEMIKGRHEPKGADIWRFPTNGYGDCEDYAILKRAMLLNNGWASSQLLMGIVYSRNEGWHAILIVRTDKGDYVLDNLRNDVHLVDESWHVFHYRQSFANPMAWVKYEPTSAVNY